MPRTRVKTNSRLERPAGRSNRTPKRPKRVLLVGLDGQALTRASLKRPRIVRAASRIIVGGDRGFLEPPNERRGFSRIGGPFVGSTSGVSAIVTPSLFHIDWSTATGSTVPALKDTDKSLPFDILEGDFPNGGGDTSQNVLSVVPATGLGFPATMANVLRVKRNNVDSYGYCSMDDSNPKWPALGIGDAQYWRVYLRIDIPDSEGRIPTSPLSHHVPEFPRASIAFANPINTWSDNDGTYHFYSQFGTGTGTGFPLASLCLGTFVNDSFLCGQSLPKFTTLRFEWMFRRDTSLGYSTALRIYNDVNGLMWSEDGVGAANGAVMTLQGGAQTTQKSHDGGYTLNSTGGQSFSIGENGGWHSYSQDVFFYWGGIALRSDTWCGPYSGGV